MPHDSHILTLILEVITSFSISLPSRFNSRLPAKYVNHPYFLVALNDINACRTRVKEAPNPIFDEEYTLDDLPGKLWLLKSVITGVLADEDSL